MAEFYKNTLDYQLEGIDEMLTKVGNEANEAKEAKKAIKALKRLQSEQANLAEIVKVYRNKRGDTLGHTVASYQNDVVMTELLKISPALIKEVRTGGLQGQTILHIAINRKDIEMVEAILDQVDRRKQTKLLSQKHVVSSKFRKTVMMGQLPLTVAALKNDKDMVDLLFRRGANIAWKDKQGDTIFHSLIRYASDHVDKTKEVIGMIQFLNSKLQTYFTQIRRPRKPYIWHMVNDKRMTPLQLAASLGQETIFSAILDLVYRPHDRQIGLFGDAFLYDVTEIDTVTQAEWERYPPEGLEKENPKEREKKSWGDFGHWLKLSHKSPAVLELLCRLPTRQAYPFLNIEAIKTLINKKWSHYKYILIAWFVWHLLVMIHISTYALYKNRVLNSHLYSNCTVTQGERDFVNSTAGISFVYALLYIFIEAVRFFYFENRWHIKIQSSNEIYRGTLVLFSIGLIIDAIWFYSHPDNHYFLILALILGWAFFGFFCRTIRPLSFYTDMFLKIMTADLARLAIVMLFQLIAYSVAIYTTFYDADSNEGFENVGRAVITIFNLMFGLDDVGILNQAGQPWLARTLYIGFVITSYVLLLNTVIAMMSMTCERMAEAREEQWQLQRLSVILQLETSIPPCLRYIPKDHIHPVRRYGIPNEEYRCYVCVFSAPDR